MPATERIRDHAGQGATTVAARRRRLRADRARQLADLLRRQILTGLLPHRHPPGAPGAAISAPPRLRHGGQCPQHALPVGGQLLLADPVDGAEFGHRARPGRRDLPEGRVVEDDVRGNALLTGLLGAPGPQGLERRDQLGRQLGRRRPCLALAPAAAGGTRGRRPLRLLAQRHLPSVPQHRAALLGEHQRAVLPSTASSPWASNCRTTPRHSPSASSSPMPNTESWSWSNWITLAVRRPSRMSMIWPAPNFCRRSRSSRHTVDSTFCATTVPSQVSGGLRQVSQLPQASASASWPK